MSYKWQETVVTHRRRSLIASVDLVEGETIAESRPFASVVKSEKMKDFCSCCFKGRMSIRQGEEIKLLRCSRCAYLQYCSVSCQKKDWESFHKRECAFMCSIKPHRPTQSVQLMSRLLIAFDGSKEVLEEVKRMISHRNQHDEEKLVRYGQMSALVMEFIKGDEKLTKSEWLSPSFLIDLFCIFGCNNANIADAEMNYIGVGIYKEIALLNHSCEPNSVVVFEGSVAKVRSIRRIEKEEEITISYVEVANSSSVRKQKLLENFYFQCSCKRCEENQENRELDQLLEAPVCINCSGSGKLVFMGREDGGFFKCENCSSSYSIESINTMEKRLEEGRRKKEQDLNGSWKDLYLLKLELFRAFHKYNQILLGVNIELMDIALKMQKWGDAETVCEEIISVYRKVYQPNWPLLGLQTQAIPSWQTEVEHGKRQRSLQLP